MSAYTDGKAAVLYWSDEFNLTIVSQEENKIVLRGEKGSITAEWNGAAWSVESEVPAYKNALVKALVSEPAESPKPAVRQARNGSVSPAVRNGPGGPLVGSSAVAKVQSLSAGRPDTYQVQGTTAPTAALILKAASEAGISFTQLKYDHRPDYIEATYRAELPGGRKSERTVSVWKNEWLASQMWFKFGKIAKQYPGCVNPEDPIDERGFPKISNGRAILELYKDLMQQWLFQGRQCQTKAMSKAAADLINSSWSQEAGELEDEATEVAMVQGAA